MSSWVPSNRPLQTALRAAAEHQVVGRTDVAQIGVISRGSNVLGVDLDLWCQIVAVTPQLRRPPSRDIVNPFTGKPAVHTPADTDAEVVVADVPIGAIATSVSGDRELDVWARDDCRDEVERIAIAIAAKLGATYTPL
jgi:hypothetical protein